MTRVVQTSAELRRGANTWIRFAPGAGVCAVLLWHFHDRYWYPTDDGFYAHVAERLLSGEILNRSIQDIHPGYIHFLNAAAFRMFGVDLVSLRYPLILAAFAQACLAYALLQQRGVLLAAVASVASTALGVIQFVDPTPNWYCLSLSVALACWLWWVPRESQFRLVGAGVLVGLLTLFRQLSGVWTAMGLLVFVLLERSTDGRGRAAVLARGLLLIMIGAIIWYLVVSPETEPGGLLLMAVWPLAILGWALFNVRATNHSTTKAVAQLLVGAVIPALPLVFYHVRHGSIGGWIDDTVLAAFGETQMPFFGHGWYGVLPLAALFQIVSTLNPVKIVNGVYWVVLPLVSAANGILVLSRLRRRDYDIEELGLPLLAAFYALGSLYFEGPLYLYYTVGLSLVSVLWLMGTAPANARRVWVSIAVGASIVAVVFHAGQSRLRTPTEILEGRLVSNLWAVNHEGLPRSSLRLDPEDRDVYGRLVSVIQKETGQEDSIFVLPNDAELYFLANRPSPVRFYNSALGIRTEKELKGVMHELTARPPRLVAFRPGDKYNTGASTEIMNLVRANYVLIDTIGGLELYRRR